MATAPRKPTGKKRPGKTKASEFPFRLRPIWLIIISLLLAFCLLVSISERMEKPFLPTWDELFSMAGLTEEAPPVAVDGELRVDVLDVGNADCLLAQCGGKTLLIDAGKAATADDVVKYLDSQHISRLDYVIATHPDSDHIGGMKKVIKAKEIGTFLMSYMPEGYTPTSSAYENMLEALLNKNLSVTEAVPGKTYALGEATLQILGPVADFTDTNNQSVVCKLTFGNRSILFTGDASAEAENAMLIKYTRQELAADILKIAHHGSSSSSQPAFLERVGAETALISCGNAYGHPHRETMEALEQRRTTVYRTDLNGQITLTCDGNQWKITTEK